MADDCPENITSDTMGDDASTQASQQAEHKPDKVHRIRFNLSTQNRLVLLITCLIALIALIVLYFTDTTFVISPGRQAGDSVGTVTDVELTYEEMFREIAPQYELDWRMLVRQAYRESRFNPLAVGKDSDAGLMQIIPSTWDEWAPKVGASDPFDPYSNVLVAAVYLAFLREYFSELGYTGDRWMLVAYNWGPHNLRQLLESGGEWEQVPNKQRRYALDILEPAADTPPGWKEIRRQPVMKTLSLQQEQTINEQSCIL